MTDVRDAVAPALQETRGKPRGDFIWYELLTPDPQGSKVFYDSVVGWDIEPEPAGEMDYRMIRRSDGGSSSDVDDAVRASEPGPRSFSHRAPADIGTPPKTSPATARPLPPRTRRGSVARVGPSAKV